MRIRTEERTFENRRDCAIDYETACNVKFEDILLFTSNYVQKKTFDLHKNNS